MQDPIRVLPGGMARSEEYQPNRQAILGSTGRADSRGRVTDAREPDGGAESSSAGDPEEVTRGPPGDRAMLTASQDQGSHEKSTTLSRSAHSVLVTASRGKNL